MAKIAYSVFTTTASIERKLNLRKSKKINVVEEIDRMERKEIDAEKFENE